jgi:mannose-6-phosphate isomerase-like protein (cupin superfamily)
MTAFATTVLPATPDAIAPDGSEVRLLCRLAGGSMAHFRLPPGACSKAVVHRTVEELWFVTDGAGEMWRRVAEQEEVVPLRPGVALSIPVGTAFQFRAATGGELCIVGVTMPPWPGDDEAAPVEGPWRPDVDGRRAR